MSRALAILVKRIRRRQDVPTFEYVAIFEATQQGFPHLHLLARTSWIPERWLSNQWAELTASPIVDIKPISGPAQTAAYVAKYVAKGPAPFGSLKRYRFSAHFRQTLPSSETAHLEEPMVWKIVPKPLSEIAQDWLDAGFEVTWLNAGMILRGPIRPEVERFIRSFPPNYHPSKWSVTVEEWGLGFSVTTAGAHAALTERPDLLAT